MDPYNPYSTSDIDISNVFVPSNHLTLSEIDSEIKKRP
jgi:hypothetical protein